MLGSNFFHLSQSLQQSTDFGQVADLLSRHLPAMVGGDSCLIQKSTTDGRILAFYGENPIARSANSRLDELNATYRSHPLFNKIVGNDPGERGLLTSDHIPPLEYRRIEFNRILNDGIEMEEALFGKLLTKEKRNTMMVILRKTAGYTNSQREIFDAILFTARAVLERISSHGVERSVRNFLVANTSDTPVALFITQPNGQTLPVSHEALRLSERWWSIDEPFYQIDDASFTALKQAAEKAWKDPATARFFETRLDLGSGPLPCHALPKLNGEIILIFPVSGTMPSAEETLKAVLTHRQREIMEWIAEGKASSEVAIILGISPRTVEKHLEAIFQRLGVENRITAVRCFLDMKSGKTS